jgi:hypothetical protein
VSDTGTVRTPWYARPWVWVAVLLVSLAAARLGGSLGQVPLVLFWVGVVGAVAATIAKAHRWASRGTQVVAWLSGVGTLVGQVYASTRPPYDNGIGDAGLVLLVTMVHVGVAWGTQPPAR